MRRTQPGLLASALALLLFATAARAQESALVKEFQPQYETLAQAAQNGDATAFEKVAKQDFKYTDLLGKETDLKGWLEAGRVELASIKSLKVAITVREAEGSGNEATVISQTKLTGETTGPDGKDGPAEITRTDKGRWVKEADGWKLANLKHVMIEGRVNNRTLKFPGNMEAEAVRKFVQPLYDIVSDLYGKRDFKTMEKLMSKDYAATDKSGKALTPQEQLDRVKEGAKNLTDPIMTITVQMVDVQGEKAKVVRVIKVIADIRLPDNRTGRMKYVGVSRDTWTKAEKGWANKASEELYSEAYIDGKPVPLSAIGGK